MNDFGVTFEQLQNSQDLKTNFVKDPDKVYNFFNILSDRIKIPLYKKYQLPEARLENGQIKYYFTLPKSTSEDVIILDSFLKELFVKDAIIKLIRTNSSNNKSLQDKIDPIANWLIYSGFWESQEMEDWMKSDNLNVTERNFVGKVRKQLEIKKNWEKNKI